VGNCNQTYSRTATHSFAMKTKDNGKSTQVFVITFCGSNAFYTHVLVVYIRMLLVCYSYVTRMLLVCTRILLVCTCFSYVTRMLLVYMLLVYMMLVCYSYVTCMLLVCTRVLLECTLMYSYVTRMFFCVILVRIRDKNIPILRKNCGLLLMLLILKVSSRKSFSHDKTFWNVENSVTVL